MAKNFHPGEMGEVVTDWNEICRSKSIDHNGSINSCLLSANQNVISTEVGKGNSISIPKSRTGWLYNQPVRHFLSVSTR